MQGTRGWGPRWQGVRVQITLRNLKGLDFVRPDALQQAGQPCTRVEVLCTPLSPGLCFNQLQSQPLLSVRIDSHCGPARERRWEASSSSRHISTPGHSPSCCRVQGHCQSPSGPGWTGRRSCSLQGSTWGHRTECIETIEAQPWAVASQVWLQCRTCSSSALANFIRLTATCQLPCTMCLTRGASCHHFPSKAHPRYATPTSPSQHPAGRPPFPVTKPT